MGSLTNFLELKLLDHVLKVGAYTQPTNLYLGLFTSDPTETGAAGTEVSGNNYARVLCNSWDVPANRTSQNSNQLNYNQASGSWGTVAYWGVFDAITAGNMLFYGSFSLPKNVVSGNAPFVAIGEVNITATTGGMTTYLANALLAHVLKGTAYTVPTNLYTGLSASSPTDAGLLTGEPSGNAYARVLSNSWSVASAGASNNTSTLTWTAASGTWGTMSHGFLSDALTGGNMLLQAPLGASQTYTSGDVAEIPTSSFVVTID